MTTYASEPGTRLGGRYRLEDRIAAGSGWAAWKAIDETLARAVTVFTFAAGYPRVTEVATAARAASRLTDPRLAQVFDVEEAWDRAYIVMEWAAGETLGDLVSTGPIEPFRAARMIAEAAAALSSAHAAGVAHMCLSPGSVRWSPTGEVKVVGLGIDAALSGMSADDPVIADTQGLGALLYVALTGHWPGPEYPPLRPAPLQGGQPCSPRQVVAGVPTVLSDLTCRAMRLRSGQEAPPLATPAELSQALVAALPPAPPPAALPSWRNQTARYSSRPPHGQSQQDGDAIDDQRHRPYGRGEADWHGDPGFAGDTWPPDGQEQRDGPSRHGRRHGDGSPRPHRRRAPARLSKGVVAAAGALALVAIVAFTLWPSGSGSPAGHASGSPTTPVTSATALQPVGATGFDPLSSPKTDPSNEQSQLAKYAIDSSPRTAWTSQWYRSADFGLLKAGAGLLIDMGKTVGFSSVTVTLGSAPGADMKLLVGSSAARSKANLDSMTQIAAKTGASGTLTFSITNSVKGRYLVIWFTQLPPLPGSRNKFEAQVFNVVVRGTA